MEKPSNFENRESIINKLIEDLAVRVEMESWEIFSDIITFFKLYETDKNAGPYLEKVAEEIGIPFEEILEYAQKLKTEYDI